MTIKFDCPNCGELIAFDDKHIGKRAHCLSCGQAFIIPAKSDKSPQTIEPDIQEEPPLPGFYRAVFVDTCKLFIRTENVTTLVFVIAAVSFKFFLAQGICCVNFITFAMVWGWLLGFYLNLIYETAGGDDKLPEIYLGTATSFLWNVIKPFLIFLITFVVVQFPFFIALSLLHNRGLTFSNVWQPGIGMHSVLQIAFILGLFVFPMAILTTAVPGDITLLRPDYLFKPIFKAFVPYLVVVALLVAFCVLEMQAAQYQTESSLAVTTARLATNLALQIIAIFAMRSIGLFYRHYHCHFQW